MGSLRGNYFKSNMEMLKKYHDHLWERMLTYEPELDTEVCYPKEGLPNLKITKKDGNPVFLHHEQDPELEIPQFLDMIPENASGVVLLTGMGLGYTPIAILKQRKNIHYLAVFDLVPDIFFCALKYMDLSAMLNDPRLILSVEPEPDIDAVLMPANLALQLENIHTLKHVPSFALNPERYEAISEDVYTIANHYNLGGGALLESGRTYTENRLCHLTSMYKNYIIDDLKGKFEGIPAILVAGGPSLDMNIHLLSGLKNRAVIIAVDSTLPTLLANGVSPDFMTAIDPFDMIYEKFAKVLPDMEKISLIASAWVAPKVAKVFKPDHIFWTFAGRDMENWMMELMGGTISTGGASTVAHLNLLAAVVMGCSPIVFIGQDLSYVGKASHASDTTLKFNKGMEGLLNSKEIHWVEGVDGGKVPTDRLFLNYKRHFEDMLSRFDGLCINSTAQGARIKGAEYMDLEDVIDTYCSRTVDIEQVISSSRQVKRNSRTFLDEFRSFTRKSTMILKEIDKVEKLQIRVANFLKRTRIKGTQFKTFEHLPDAIKRQIRGMDKSHKRIDGAGKVWGALDELTMEGLKESERQKLSISRLKNDPDQYTGWLIKNIERLDHLNKVRKKELTYFRNRLSNLISHLEAETKSTRNLRKRPQDKRAFETIAKLYFNTGDFALLEQLCLKAKEHFKHLGMFHFYTGCIALLKNEFSKAEGRFKEASQLDPEIKVYIANFRTSLANEYLKHANFFNTYDEDTVRLMLIKGLKYGGPNSIQASKINILIDTDMKDAALAIDSNAGQDAVILLKKWTEDIEKHEVLEETLKKEKCAGLYKLYGNALVREGRFEKAIENFERALSYDHDDAESYLLTADACFAVNDFNAGITALNNAVCLNREYAKYWENMGDNLLKNGQFNDALAAFEQFMLAVPENRLILKKIAKCYLELGQLEAAKEALNQLKSI